MKAKSKSKPRKRSKAAPCQLYDADQHKGVMILDTDIHQVTVKESTSEVVMIEKLEEPRKVNQPLIRLRTTFEFFDPTKIKGWAMMDNEERIDAACSAVGIQFKGDYSLVEIKKWPTNEKWYITF